jgi:hypothetical protein
MFRLKFTASNMTKLISGTLVTIVVAFSVGFSYLLLQLMTQINTASAFFSSEGALMYMTVEGVFLLLVIFAAFSVLRKKK